MMVEIDGREHTIYRGTDYSKYLIPIDCPPSFNYRSRWGYSAPPLTHFEKWFNDDINKYRQELMRLSSYNQEFRRIPDDADRFSWEPGWFGGPINAIDSAMIYHFVASRKPQKFVEIGSGMSTRFARRAVRDQSLETKIVCIDPAPRMDVSRVCDEHHPIGLEQCSLDMFSSLLPGDILFFDGSHRSFANSDVTIFFLEIVPALAPGVIVHVHDILLPLDYPPIFLKWYWSEQYILGAYLIGAKPHIDILMPTTFIHMRESLISALPPKPFSDAKSVEFWKKGGSIWFTHRD